MNDLFEELEQCQIKLQQIQKNIKELLILYTTIESKCDVYVSHFEILKKLIPHNILWINIRNLIQNHVEDKQEELKQIGQKIEYIGCRDLFSSKEKK